MAGLGETKVLDDTIMQTLAKSRCLIKALIEYYINPGVERESWAELVEIQILSENLEQEAGEI